MKHSEFKKKFSDLQRTITDKEEHIQNYPLGQRKALRNKINRLKGAARLLDKKYWKELYRDEPEMWWSFFIQGAVKPNNDAERKAVEKFLANRTKHVRLLR